MRFAFYDSPEYKLKQAEITRKYWKLGTFDFHRKQLVTKKCANHNCQSPFQIMPSDPKLYCGRSCAASIRNRKREYKKKLNYCLNCKDLTKRPSSKYCSIKCQWDYSYKEYINRWKQGMEDGNIGINTRFISSHIKRYLKQKYQDKCSICGWSQKNPVTGVVPLEVDHIDGNPENNKEENLRSICPNCHALTPYFRNLNKGNGRAWRIKYLKSINHL